MNLVASQENKEQNNESLKHSFYSWNLGRRSYYAYPVYLGLQDTI